jgi:hypothetical protein
MVLIEEAEHIYNPSPTHQYYDSAPNCYKEPHYFLGGLSVLRGFLSLGLASACWGKVGGSGNSNTVVTFLWLGIVALMGCLWLVHYGFALIVFKVYPRSSFSSPLFTPLVPTHLSHALWR